MYFAACLPERYELHALLFMAGCHVKPSALKDSSPFGNDQ